MCVPNPQCLRRGDWSWMQGPAKVIKQVGDQSVVEVVDKSVDMKDSVKAEDLLDQVWWWVTRRRWW